MRSQFLLALSSIVVLSLTTLGSVPAQTTEHGGAQGAITDQHGRQDSFLQSRRLGDVHVMNSQNERLGTFDNLIIDLQTGQIFYGILDTGLFGKHIAVPWSAVHLEKKGDQQAFVVNVDKARLTDAPTFSDRHMSNLADEKWRESVNKFFGVREAARPAGSEMKQHESHQH